MYQIKTQSDCDSSETLFCQTLSRGQKQTLLDNNLRLNPTLINFVWYDLRKHIRTFWTATLHVVFNDKCDLCSWFGDIWCQCTFIEAEANRIHKPSSSILQLSEMPRLYLHCLRSWYRELNIIQPTSSFRSPCIYSQRNFFHTTSSGIAHVSPSAPATTTTEIPASIFAYRGDAWLTQWPECLQVVILVIQQLWIFKQGTNYLLHWPSEYHLFIWDHDER